MNPETPGYRILKKWVYRCLLPAIETAWPLMATCGFFADLFLDGPPLLLIAWLAGPLAVWLMFVWISANVEIIGGNIARMRKERRAGRPKKRGWRMLPL
jgi:hypothetical protein